MHFGYGVKMIVAFFGFDAADAAIRRRATAFVHDGVDVLGFMMRRGAPEPTSWRNIDLGETRPGAFVERARRIVQAARIAAKPANDLASADLIYARTLDMLICAFLAKRRSRLDTPVVYECLDIHRLLTRPDAVGSAMRAIERRLLRRCRLLVVSSPGFLRHHFEPRYGRTDRTAILENRLAAADGLGPRPEPRQRSAGDPLRIGWFGVLRCSRSLGLLAALADAFGDKVQIRLRGIPAETEIPDFDAVVAPRPNMIFGGRYKAPDDLAALYGEVDLVWAGDFMEAGFNSSWLLPNRLYEGGYYTTPAIAPAQTETAAWIEARGAGFSLSEPLEETLPGLVETLLAAPDQIMQKEAALFALPNDAFIQPPGELKRLVEQALR